MEVKFFGTRGSVPISRAESIKYGGNTTCLRVDSKCLPEGLWLAVDAGTGFVPFAAEALAGKAKEIAILSTHYHHDHTQGALLAPVTFIKSLPMRWYGAEEDGIGPKEMLDAMMLPPYFPVSFEEVASHFFFKSIKHPAGQVMVIHPEGGIKLITVDEFERAEASRSGQIAFGDSGRYGIDDSLVIRMYKTNHPERTTSYRFEERPTGKNFVILTDHENLDAWPQAMKTHLTDVDLLVMDAQYSREKYERSTAGYGHGTPDYCASTAAAVGAKKLGLTHHDPLSNDCDIEAILAAAQETLKGNGRAIPVFACYDYQTVTV